MAEALRAKIDRSWRFANGWVVIHQIFAQKGTSPTNYFCMDS